MSFRPHIQVWTHSLKIFGLVLALSALSHASVTLLLEEPYGKLGFFTSTGHAAVYLSGVCAETPVLLRACVPGETGVVLSRYDGVGGYDWVAIPLIPYLYAVEHAEDVPLFTDPKMTFFLRDRYRRKYLEDIVPDVNNGETPGGNWYQLVGSSYDRTMYGFEVETTPAQDEALIQKLNSSSNRSHFHLVSRNCADFAKDILNSYFPKSLHRSLIADLGVTTPKQMAKLMTRYADRHSQLHFSKILIPQVPGTMPRSTAVHGVVESFFKAKKYIVPSVVLSPIFAGCVAAVYVGTGAGHFEPGRNAQVFVLGGNPEPPVGREDLRAFREQLKHFIAGTYPDDPHRNLDKSWGKLQSHAKNSVDEQGRPVLEMQVGDNHFQIGVSAENILQGDAPPQLVRQLLEARLEAELRRHPPNGISETEVARDWELLQKTISGNDSRTTVRTARRDEVLRANQQ